MKKNNGRAEKIIDFKKIFAIMEKNFIVMTRDKIRLIPLLIFPIVMILVLGYTSGNTPKHISTVIVSYDNSPLSEAIEQAVQNSQTFSVRYVVSTEGEARRMLDEGKVLVIIEIPQHLQDNVDAGLQTGITVIVDESDAAVAATSKQGMNVIINTVAKNIGAQKLAYYKQSLNVAEQKIGSYINMQTDSYGLINANAAVADAKVMASKDILDNYIQALTLTVPQPTPIASGDNPITINNGNTVIYTNESVVLREPAAAGKIKAQINMLQQSSDLLQSAQDNVHSSNMMSLKAEQQYQELHQKAYQENVVKSLSVINVFVQSSSTSVIQPLVYEDKPAYGTGKRAIDFLIPSLIALTIFQGAVMGMGRSVAGEKRDGSLTRVFLTPTSNTTIISGTLLFYVLFEICRAAFLIIVSIILFNIHIEGSYLLIALVLAIYISIATSIGMMISSMVNTEQQYMAMAMLVSLPTMFLAGAFFPVQAMPHAMQAIAGFLPVTYAGDALRGIMVKGFSLDMIAYPVFILLVFLALMILGLSLTFKRDIE